MPTLWNTVVCSAEFLIHVGVTIQKCTCVPESTLSWRARFGILLKWYTQLDRSRGSIVTMRNFPATGLALVLNCGYALIASRLPCFVDVDESRNLKGGFGSLFDPNVNAMGRRLYFPSRMEVSYCTFGLGMIIRHDLRTLSLTRGSSCDNLYMCAWFESMRERQLRLKEIIWWAKLLKILEVQ